MTAGGRTGAGRGRPGTAPPTPLLELPQAAITLAAVSGGVNAWTFANAGSFATVQSGNLVTVGVRAVEGDWSSAAPPAAAVLAFGLGALLCAIFVTETAAQGRHYSGWVLGAEAVLLVACTALAAAQLVPAMALALVLSFMAGVQGNAFHREDGMIYGNTAETFVVQMAFSMLGRGVLARGRPEGRHHLRSAALYGGVFVAFACGAGLGSLLNALWPPASLALGALALAALAALAGRARRPVDPSI